MKSRYIYRDTDNRAVPVIKTFFYDGRLYALCRVERSNWVYKQGLHYEILHKATGAHIQYINTKKDSRLRSIMKLVEKGQRTRLSTLIQSGVDGGRLRCINEAVEIVEEVQE